MKELSIEEKAKAYDEKLDVARHIYADPSVKDEDKYYIEVIFHELAESEDERIRKDIVFYIAANHKDDGEKARWLYWLEKQGEQKSIDKVEPKFKVGDWVVYCNDDVDLITDIEENGYCINNGGYIPFVCESDIRLWTIEDAKDGDVLCTKNKCCPFIYDKGRYNNGLAYYYAGIDVSGNLNIKSPHNMLAHFGRLDNIRPATQEQRDLLFQKMHEAGYEWDADKKELKKIEQKPTWSEEDEEIYRKCICAMRASACGFPEEEKFVEQVDNWLKSLRPQTTWKPTEEQMKSLAWVVEHGNTCQTAKLKEIFEQLKAL